MFDLKWQIRLKQAKNALRDGRLDEAFAIAMEKEVRSLRGGQVLLEELVKPLLDRAAKHLAGGRNREALLDVEHAIQAGGNRPEALSLREEIQEKLRASEAAFARRRNVLEAARKHLQVGSIAAGKDLLQNVSVVGPEISQLRHELEHRERKAEKARARAREHLSRGELVEAILAAGEALGLCSGHEEVPQLLYDLKAAVIEKIQRGLREGDVSMASDLLSKLEAVAGDCLETRALADSIADFHEAWRAFHSGDYEKALTAMTRLEKKFPKTSWIEESVEDLAKMKIAHTRLMTGPLGSARLREGVHGEESNPTVTSAGPAMTQPAPDAARESPRAHPHLGHKFFLWVDGVGTYLVLTGDRITLGRAGGSAHADVQLAADLAGAHAEIVRVDEDYFLVAVQDPIQVGGRPVERKLLAGGDVMDLGPRCRMTFHLPTPVSTTAVLALHRGQRIEGDVRSVILLKEHLILGPKGKSHVEIDGIPKNIVLTREDRGLVCRAQDEISLNGSPAGREAVLHMGVQVQVGDVTFTVTDSSQGRA